jgi:dihydrofolate synthase/folylpolyglutamate synthase
MDVLGDTREAIAAEKLAVVRPGMAVVLGEPEWRELAEAQGPSLLVLTAASNLALAIAAAETFLGKPVEAGGAADVTLPGRLEHRGEHPLEIWDGAHNLAGVAYLLPRLPERDYVLVSSILADKRPELMLQALSVLGPTLVATESSNARSLPAGELAAHAERYFDHVEIVVDPSEARSRARALAGPDGAVLVSGSLYLLTDLSGAG